jgi:(R,R)-butanediol dehydrogenase / meso-butanediol dehydrogenase / diacetyl reductase
MKAAIYVGNGHFELVEKSMPTPLTGECLLEISRAGICGTDLRIFQGHMNDRVGSRRILGHEAVSVVKETCSRGKFRVGDRVVVEPTIFCGKCTACQKGTTHVCQNLRILGIDEDGAFQQFWVVPEKRLHKLSHLISDDHAVMIEPLAVAVHSLRRAALCAGETVTVIGAGPIGLLIALLAQKAGTKVFVLEINPHRLQFARRLQLTAIDSTGKNAEKNLKDLTQGTGTNVLFEASGSMDAARMMTLLPAVHGRVILVGIHSHHTPIDFYQIFLKELSIQGVRAYSHDDFKEAIRQVSGGEIDLTPFISKQYPLEELQQAMERAISGAPVIKTLINFAA